MLTKTDWAYFAGLVDGEAHLDIYHKRMSDIKRGYAREYIFALSNTNLELLKELSGMFGDLCWITEHHRNKEWKMEYSLHFNHTMLRNILPEILPYLKLRKRAVELMLQSLALMKTGNSEEREKQLVKIDLELKAIHDQQNCATRKRDYSLLMSLAKKYNLT